MRYFAPSLLLLFAAFTSGCATVSQDNSTHSHANQWRDYTGSGTEPFWRVTLDGETIDFEHIGVTSQSVAQTEPTPIANGHRLVSPFTVTPDDGSAPLSYEMAVEITHAVCDDGMSDVIYPDTVTVAFRNFRFSGCGGKTGDLLAGAWTVIRLGAQDIDTDPAITLQFDRDGGVSGSGGCNRYHATYTLAEGIGFGPIAATRMACAEPNGGNESAFFGALAEVYGIRISEDGVLTLYGDEGDAIVARR